MENHHFSHRQGFMCILSACGRCTFLSKKAPNDPQGDWKMAIADCTCRAHVSNSHYEPPCALRRWVFATKCSYTALSRCILSAFIGIEMANFLSKKAPNDPQGDWKMAIADCTCRAHVSNSHYEPPCALRRWVFATKCSYTALSRCILSACEWYIFFSNQENWWFSISFASF